MVKRINKYTITSIILLGIIIYAGIHIAFTNKSKLKEIIFGDLTIKEKILAIEDVYRKLPNEEKILNIYSAEQNLIKSSLYEDSEYGVIIKDTHGKLHFPYKKTDVTPCADNIKTFNEELKKIGVPLMYVQCPAKKLEGYTQFPLSEYDDFSNEMADEFLEKIKDTDINVLDLRKSIREQDINRELLFYKTDHHWTTPTAFWATGEVVKYINQKLGFKIASNFFDKDNYSLKEYKNSFLGSLGRRVGVYAAGVDDYTLIYPNFETNYEVYYPRDNYWWIGDFYDVFVRTHILESEDITANKHGAYFEYEYGNLIIKNKKLEEGKKILLIKDSFSLPVAAFLSTGLKELHLVDLRQDDAPKDLVKYVLDNKFDAVMIMYNTQVFAKPMFDLLDKK